MSFSSVPKGVLLLKIATRFMQLISIKMEKTGLGVIQA